MKKVGISLSGGGVKALIYTGVLQAIEDNNITIDVVAGLSGGGLVASLYASGYSGRQILEIAKDTNFFELIKPATLISGELLDTKILKSILKQYIKAETFEQLNKKLIILCSDIDKKEKVAITSGDLLSAVIASCALPPIINPINRDGKRLVDGGFSTTYGTGELKKMGARYVIGVSIQNWIDVNLLPRIIRNLIEALGVAWQTIAQDEQRLNPADFILTNFEDSTGMLDFGVNKELLYKKGYDKTVANIQAIKDGLNKKTSILDFIFQ